MKATIDSLNGGLNPDLASAILPDGVWSEARNVRFRNGAVEKCPGHVAVFGSASVTPIWVAPVSDGLTTFWTYGSEGRLYATDGSLHADVSSVSYSADTALGYTGGAYHGYMIANDGVTAPQSWQPSLSNKFQPLTAWPASTTCEVIRAFGDFLVALRITESGIYNARLIRWSHRGAAGELPTSWDYTDPTVMTGRTELGQTHDALVDCLPLRDSNIIYKQFHTWTMQYVGGDDVFGFRELFREAGLLTENCAAAFGPRHFVVTGNDVIVHDGNDARSIADKRVRKWLFNAISTSRYDRAFVAADYRDHEMLFCFPEEGNDWPNLAACWNWTEDSWDVRELGRPVSAANSGLIQASGVTFDEDPGEFNTGPAGTFDEYEYTPWSQRLLLAAATRQQLYMGNATLQWDGTRFPLYAIRTNMALTKDVGKIKRVARLYPKVVGATDETVWFRVGSSAHQDGPVAFGSPINFVVGTDYKLDVRVSGRFIHLMMAYSGDSPLRLLGFDVEFWHEGAR